jgi:NAD-dependent SIR2 family protein deacetylase
MNLELEAARAARLIAGADGLVVAAGAGMGVDSGLPDFRGDHGFWKAYPALARAGTDFRAAASAPSFASYPERAWGFYGHRLALYRRTVPHAGFALLRAWGEAMEQGYSVFTSNVDGQFQRAGFDARRVHECHGSIHHLQCSRACCDEIWSAEGLEAEVDEQACRWRGALPSCPHCGAVARPNILMFNDGQWCEQRTARQAGRQSAWLAGLRRPLVVEIGAGSDIPTVRYFSERLAARPGAALVRINPREAEVGRARDVGLPLGALEALGRIADALRLV